MIMSSSNHDYGKVKKFVNCKILRNNEIINEYLWVRDGKIIDPEPLFFDEKVRASELVDCHGALIAPGLIDLQINGGFGVDFSVDIVDESSADECVTRVAKGILAHGVTSFCPTLVTSTTETYKRVLKHVDKRAGSRSLGATVLGMHLEGPFISLDKRGAHTPELVRDLKGGFDDLSSMFGEENLRKVSIVTLAPELDADGKVVRALRERDIFVSLGHSTAKLIRGEEAMRQGATLITHLFNAMAAFHHRDPGLVGLITTNALPNRKLFYGIIADGVHTHQATIKLAYKANFDSMCLVTDGICALGLEDGVYTLGQQTIEVKGLRAAIAGTETLAGAIGTLWFGVKNLYEWSGCSLVDAIQAASLHPAQALGIEKSKGTLSYGADADFIMIEAKSVSILSTWIAGERVHSA